jgi:hypothetical protein
MRDMNQKTTNIPQKEIQSTLTHLLRHWRRTGDPSGGEERHGEQARPDPHGHGFQQRRARSPLVTSPSFGWSAVEPRSAGPCVVSSNRPWSPERCAARVRPWSPERCAARVRPWSGFDLIDRLGWFGPDRQRSVERIYKYATGVFGHFTWKIWARNMANDK